MQSEESGVISRLVVALDASPCSRQVLRTAARIAAGFGAHLESIFVEDINLLQVTDLPICQEVIIGSATIRPLDRPALERDFRTLTEQVEAWTAALAQEHDINWRFQVRRGNVTQELMSAASQGDLLGLGRFGWSLFPQPSRLGSVARTLITEHPFPLLLLDREIRPGQPVLAIFDGSPADTERLMMAAELAKIYQSRLTVLLEADHERAASARQRQAETLLAERTRPGRRPASQRVEVVYRRVDAHNLFWQIQLACTDQGCILLSRRRDGLASLPLALILI
jgi:nucleotide-binding universal stress UspA family protein